MSQEFYVHPKSKWIDGANGENRLQSGLGRFDYKIKECYENIQLAIIFVSIYRLVSRQTYLQKVNVLMSGNS